MKFARKDSLFSSNPPTNGGMDHERALPAPTREPVRPRGATPATQLNAFLGRGCIYEGKLTFEGRVRIDGKFTGEIFSNDTLEVGPDAEMEAELDVATVIIAGRVDGNVKSRSRCDLRAPANVIGNITSPIITMDEGVRFDGEMRMSMALDEAVRATTQRAPAAMEMMDEPEYMDHEESMDTYEGEMDDLDRQEALGIPDPSDLLKPIS